MILDAGLAQATDLIEGQETSPDHAFTAGVVLRAGSAVVHNTIVVILHDGSGRIDPGSDKVLFELEQVEAPRVGVEWKGPHVLTVHYGNGPVYTQLNSWKNVAISYEQD